MYRLAKFDSLWLVQQNRATKCYCINKYLKFLLEQKIMQISDLEENVRKANLSRQREICSVEHC